METQNEKSNTWLDMPLSRFLPEINLEFCLVVFILLAAVFSRFYHIDLRVMSHDEVNHVVPSWDLFQGRGYRHDPVTHGPLQFHLVALSYFLLGDNDFSSRVPAAIFSIATVAFVLLAFRRYLGRSGSLIAGFLFLISPFMLFYGRYTRNEAYVALFGVVILYSILRYLEKGDKPSLYLLVIATALNFTTKETAFIYTAQALLFLAVVFLNNVLSLEWTENRRRNRFIFLAMAALLLLGGALGFAAWNASVAGDNTVVEASPEVANDLVSFVVQILSSQMFTQILLVVGALILTILAIVALVKDIGWQKIREQKSFSLLIVLGTLVLPQLVAFPIKLAGWDPLDYSSTGLIRTAIALVIFAFAAILVGILWNPKLWLNCAAIFYGIFTVFYTTFFTNGQGFLTGLVGSLGYWLSQQGVQRGSQPWYYYSAIQLPVYEFLAVAGAILAIYFAIRHKRFLNFGGVPPAAGIIPTGEGASLSHKTEENNKEPQSEAVPVMALLVYWSITSLIAYSIAGEKMPWITVHIALPLLLTAGWGLGFLVDTTPWKKLFEKRGLLALLLTPIFITSLASVLASVLGTTPPFQGNTTQQLQSTTAFFVGVITVIFSGGGIMYFLQNYEFDHVLRMMTTVIFSILAVLTIRAAYMASYINYDNAKEYLVYAHAASGPKEVLKQVEEISRRTTGGLDIVVAYDNDGLYPYWWYLRNYPNHKWYTDKPTRDLQEAPLIIAGDANLGKLDSIVKDNYISIDYIRLWWPNQDYFNLTWERIKNAFTDRDMRAAIFDIWLNRDYTQYALKTNNSNLTLEDWQPSSRMRFYIRKDIVAQMWKFGSTPVVPELVDVNPYQQNMISLNAVTIIESAENEQERMQAPRGVAVTDDAVYVADSQNNRIQKFTLDGELLTEWGKFADASAGQAPGGTFNEPWGIAVGQDGSVYVTDTWNHRVQKFNADGKFIRTWGRFGQGESPDALWGPRGILVDSRNRVYVADTGNKRIVVYNSEGEYITQFGSAGSQEGQFDEPVGIALNENTFYVADTWNQRVQAFSIDLANDVPLFTYKLSWNIDGWFGQSLDNKPFICVNDAGNIFVTDPEGYQVLEFSPEGLYLQGWGGYSSASDGFGLPSGIASGRDGSIWVSDAGNNRLMKFMIP